MSVDDVFDQSVSFKELGLRDSVLKGVSQAGFAHPTKIQVQMIPSVLSGKDVIGQAKTGTGKTAAFGLPILHNADKSLPMGALVLVPTRELAAQLAGELSTLGQFTPIRTSCIIGGESMRQQVRSIKQGGHIIVGTPGRIMAMHSRRQIHFRNIKCVVLDEVDRMLDIGFREDIRRILKDISTNRQTIFVSATIDEQIERLARSFTKRNAIRIRTTSGALTVSLVQQNYLSVEPWDKRALLLHLLRHKGPETTLVFCRTKATVHRVSRYLRDKGIDAREIHGDMEQAKRNRVMQSMRSGNLDVLIASDLAARGLDIDLVTHVINYDLPEDPELYVHRIGRTARAGRQGVAWAFVTPDQGQLLTEIEKLAGVMIEHMPYPDFKPGPVPEDVAHQRQRQMDRPKRDLTGHLSDRAAPTDIEQMSAEQLAQMFPNGVIPKSMPKRTLGTRFRSRRGRR